MQPPRLRGLWLIDDKVDVTVEREGRVPFAVESIIQLLTRTFLRYQVKLLLAAHRLSDSQLGRGVPPQICLILYHFARALYGFCFGKLLFKALDDVETVSVTLIKEHFRLGA